MTLWGYIWASRAIPHIVPMTVNMVLTNTKKPLQCEDPLQGSASKEKFKILACTTNQFSHSPKLHAYPSDPSVGRFWWETSNEQRRKSISSQHKLSIFWKKKETSFPTKIMYIQHHGQLKR